MSSAWIFGVFAVLFTGAFAACSDHDYSDCPNAECEWQTGTCVSTCVFEGGKFSSCVNTKVDECAAITNPEGCSFDVGCRWNEIESGEESPVLLPGACIHSNPESCDVQVGDGEQCPPGCTASYDNGLRTEYVEMLFCESTTDSRSSGNKKFSLSSSEPSEYDEYCAQFSAEPWTECTYFGGCELSQGRCVGTWNDTNGKASNGTDYCSSYSVVQETECTRISGSNPFCTVSNGSCVVDSLKSNAKCRSYSTAITLSQCAAHASYGCYVLNENWNETGNGTYWNETGIGTDLNWVRSRSNAGSVCSGSSYYGTETYCAQFSTEISLSYCEGASSGECEVNDDGQCVTSEAFLHEKNQDCTQYSSIPISQCTEYGMYCKVSDSQCKGLSREEQCSKRSLYECQYDCQVDANGFCVPRTDTPQYTPKCVLIIDYLFQCTNTDTNVCNLKRKYQCRPIDCGERNDREICDQGDSCSWSSGGPSCVPYYDCARQFCYTNYPTSGAEGQCVFSQFKDAEGICENKNCSEQRTQASCDANDDCGWNPSSYVGQCVDRSCSPEYQTFKACCPSGGANCPYCRSNDDEECPQSFSNCATTPSFSACCALDSNSAECIAFCDKYPNLCLNESDCISSPSYSLCCHQSGSRCDNYCKLYPEAGTICREYCRVHQWECGLGSEEGPDGGDEPEPPAPKPCDQRTPLTEDYYKCGEDECFYTEDLDKCSTDCAGHYKKDSYSLTCVLKNCGERTPDPNAPSNKCGLGCTYTGGQCSVACSSRTPVDSSCGSADCYFVDPYTCSPDKEDVAPASPPNLPAVVEVNNLENLLDPNAPIQNKNVELPPSVTPVGLPPLSLDSNSGGTNTQPATVAVKGAGVASTTLAVTATSYKLISGSADGDGPKEACLVIVGVSRVFLMDLKLSFSTTSPTRHMSQRRNVDSSAFAVVDGSDSELNLNNVDVRGTIPTYFIRQVSGKVVLYDVNFTVSLSQYFVTLPTGSGSSSFQLSSSSLKLLFPLQGWSHALFHEATATSGTNDVTFNRVEIGGVTVTGTSGGAQTAVIYHSRNAGSSRKVVVKNSKFHDIAASDPYYAPFVISGTVSPSFKATFSKTEFYDNEGYYAGAIYADANTTIEILSPSFWNNEYKYTYVGYGNDVSAVGDAKVTISAAEGEATPCSSSGLPTMTPNIVTSLGTCPSHARASVAPKIPLDTPETPKIDRKLPGGAIAAIVIAAVVVVAVTAITVVFLVYQVVKSKQEKKVQEENGAKEPKQTGAGQEMENMQ